MFRYYSKPDVKNRTTIVAEVDNENLKFAVARCSDADRFCRKCGRSIAEGRLKNGHVNLVIPVCGLDDGLNKGFLQLAKMLEEEMRQFPERINGRKYKGAAVNN